MILERLNTFSILYREELAKAIVNHPTDYAWPADQVSIVANRMLMAVERGSFNKDSHAFKAVCKRLGIQHTYAAINRYLKGQDTATTLGSM